MNTYGLFAERTRSVLGDTGKAGLILPSGIITDDSTKLFFQLLIDDGELISAYDFENRRKLFPDVDSRMKFCLLTLTGRRNLASGTAFIFFAHTVSDIEDDQRRFTLTAADIALVNPNTRTCPTFRNRRDSEITIRLYSRMPILLNEEETLESIQANPWGIITKPGLFNMAGDSRLLVTDLAADGIPASPASNVYRRAGRTFLPLYEGKMYDFFDHRASRVVISRTATIRQGQSESLTLEQHEDPNCLPAPRYWVSAEEVQHRVRSQWDRPWVMGWKEVTSATNHRTMVPGVFPLVGIGHKIPIFLPSAPFRETSFCLLAQLSAYCADYMVRQKLGGTSLTPFTVKQLPVLSPSFYTKRAAWSHGSTLQQWIAPRVVELTYTAWDLEGFAEDCGYNSAPFRWDEARRFLLRCELDAAFFHLYGIERDDVDYIMGTFPIVKRKDEAAHGDYRTKLQILKIYDAMQRAIDTGEPYQTPLDPPPADPSVAHLVSTRPDWAKEDA